MLVTTVNIPLLFLHTRNFLRAAIHSAVRVFTGEADEIAAQSLCGFCDKISTNREASFFRYIHFGLSIATGFPSRSTRSFR